MTLLILSLFILLVTLGTAFAQQPNPLEFNEGLVLSGADFDTHERGDNKTIHFHVFDQKTGVLIPDNESECHHHLYRLEPRYEDLTANGNFTVDAYGITLFLNASNFEDEGAYGLNVRCNSTREINGEEQELGGFTRYEFEVRDHIDPGSTGKILWMCPADWTFPIVFILISLLMIVAALTFDANLFGIFGGLMFAFSYLYIGACSPILLSPVLIGGLLIAFAFAIRD